MNYATRYISELKLHASTPRELTAKTGHTFRIGDEVATTVKASSQGRIIGFSKARALALGHSRPENEAIIHFYGGEFSELYPSGFVSRVHIDSIVSTNSL